MQFGRFICLATFLGTCLLGCGYAALKSYPEDTLDELAALVSQITLGETTRADVHEILGGSLSAASDSRIEVFRAVEGRGVEVGLIFPYPFTLIGPVLAPGSRSRGYMMLEYDARDVVARLKYRHAEGDEFTKLEIPPYTFIAQTSEQLDQTIYEEVLLTNVEEDWPTPPDGHCRVLLSAWMSSAQRTFSIRGKLKQKLGPLARDGLMQWYLPVGNYKAHVSFNPIVFRGREKLNAEFNCNDGETVLLEDTVRYSCQTPPPEQRWLYGICKFTLLGRLRATTELAHHETKLIIFYNSR